MFLFFSIQTGSGIAQSALATVCEMCRRNLYSHRGQEVFFDFIAPRPLLGTTQTLMQ
jgi:hypothetical protein